ncbi:periplasmic binding protein-like I [Dunaliella salina]|uniref:Periplasmic binding protein-like I n=1 Tax=Dunaliella salina TaxID=3046 RepID=A0ABQ7GPE9_DUNSA|nr:periplasmic binding protein-like I [Dunaliella salina]|eukprot:KAF5836476.1 periplasmic binding protein-like I [Dunaliella salina]
MNASSKQRCHDTAASRAKALERLLIMLLIHCAQSRVFRVKVGIAVGNTAQCSEMEDAHRGHKLFADKLNSAQTLFIEDSKGEKHRLLFEYTRYNDDCDQGKHNDLVRKLIFEDKVHFMLGSTPVFAESESLIANNAEKLMYHCCVGPDSLYEKDMKNIFGITVSNTRYPLKALKSMGLAGNVQRLYIFSLSDNIFTSSTCESAAEFAGGILAKLSPNVEVIKMRQYTSSNVSADSSFYDHIVDEAIDLQADALLGCDFKEPGIAVTRALANRNYYVKALWLTVAPAHADFVPSLGPEVANNVLSAGQWHPAMTFADEFFGTTAEYRGVFEQAFNLTPSYVAAQASATSYSLAVAVRDAFQGCTLPDDPGLDMDQLLSNSSMLECVDEDGDAIVVNGYKHVKRTLAQQDLLTFFGEVAFNRYRRNIAKSAATFQILDGMLQAVLPLEFANKAIVMPWPEPENHENVPATIGVMKQLLWDGSWESGKAMYKSALVALEPLTEARLATKASATGMDPASTAEGAFQDANASSTAPLPATEHSSNTSFCGSEPHGQPVRLPSRHANQASNTPDLEDPASSHSHGEQSISTGKQPGQARKGSVFFPAVSKLLGGTKEHDVDQERQPPVHGSAVPVLTKKQVLQLLWQYKCLQVHPNIVPVMGVVWSLPSLPSNLPVLVLECEELGALSSVQENETLVLDAVKKLDIAMDLATALAYLHAQVR